MIQALKDRKGIVWIRSSALYQRPMIKQACAEPSGASEVNQTGSLPWGAHSLMKEADSMRGNRALTSYNVALVPGSVSKLYLF